MHLPLLRFTRSTAEERGRKTGGEGSEEKPSSQLIMCKQPGNNTPWPALHSLHVSKGIKQNAEAVDFVISDEDMAAIAKVDENFKASGSVLNQDMPWAEVC